jgi:type VI secretion system secreted protein VgrG
MTEERISFESPVIPEGTFQVTSLHGREGMSSLYELHFTLALNTDLPLDEDTVSSMMETPVDIGFVDGLLPWLPWTGVLRKMELVFVREGRTAIYRAVVVPTLWYLTQTIRSRVFLKKSVSDIAADVFSAAGVSGYELKLGQTYDQREYTVQYQESDFDFLCRLFEHEGIFFYFDYETCDEGCPKLVITDSNGQLPSPYDVEYQPRSGTVGQAAGVLALSRTYQAVPERVVLREFNEQTPASGLHASALVSAGGYGLQVLLGEHFLDVGAGERLAKVRAEERALRNHLYQGLGTMRDMRPGHTFQLTNHPFGEMEQAYVVTGMRHRMEVPHGENAGVPFSSELELVPKATQWRPPRVTRRPRVEGLIHAKIAGDVQGAPAPIDQEGRYEVIVPFDLCEPATVGGGKSCRIRKAQAFAGPSYGDHFPLHVGAEVLLAHVEGDPDRPVIVAAFANADTPTTVVNENAQKSIIKTKGQIIVDLDDSPAGES